MFTFELIPDEGEKFEVEATSRDIVQWEKRHKDNQLGRLEKAMRMTDMYSLAHVAATRKGLFTGSLADFMETVDLDLADRPDKDGDEDEDGGESGPTSRDR